MKRYFETISRLTGVKMKTLEEYAETGSVPELLNNIGTLTLTPAQKGKMKALKDFLIMHNEMCVINEVERLDSSSKAADFAKKLLRYKSREEFYVICLNSQNKVINYKMASEGSINEAAVYPRNIAEYVLSNERCISVILAHNHPGGSVKPSGPDISVTRKIKECLKTLNITVHDHIIITDDSWYSFAENGAL